MGKPPSQRARDRRIQGAARVEAERPADRKRRIVAWGLIVGVAMMAITTVAGSFIVGNPDDDTTAPTTAPTTTFPVSTVAPPAPLTLPDPGGSITGTTPCPADDGSEERITSFSEAPPVCLDTLANDYDAVIHTTAGDLTITLFDDEAPITVNNFVVLSRYGFYDDTPVFEMFARGWIRAGDATGPVPGTGGPGYSIPSEIPEVGSLYQWGTLAMYHPPGDTARNGSMFQIGAGDLAPSIDPVYTVFGLVLDEHVGPENDERGTLTYLNQQGDPTTRQPLEEHRITGIDIIETPDDDGETEPAIGVESVPEQTDPE